MLDSVMIWNEPNNKSHWDIGLDRDWALFADMARTAGQALKRACPHVPLALGGISPIDPDFMRNMQGRGVLDAVDMVAVHGFPLDWNHWQINDWPDKLEEIRQVTSKPLWVSEVGISTFGAEEVQLFGLQRTAELLIGRVARIHWYSLFDLPKAWPATTRHREAEGSSYYRHFYMGLVREDGTPKLAYDAFRAVTPDMGLCQWFHFEDHRLDEAVARMKDLGVTYLRTGLSWADWYRPDALAWFDRQMQALRDFQVTVTYCFTPAHRGLGEDPNYTSPPIDPQEFADFCVDMTRRYGGTPEALPLEGTLAPTGA